MTNKRTHYHYSLTANNAIDIHNIQYMVILFLLFVVQFSIAFGCLSFTNQQKYSLASSGWTSASNKDRHRAEKFWSCCGFDTVKDYCSSKCCLYSPDCQCPPCDSFIVEAIDSGLSITGWLGLLFSFTEFIGVWLTIRYRNQKDPRSDPSAFLWFPSSWVSWHSYPSLLPCLSYSWSHPFTLWHNWCHNCSNVSSSTSTSSSSSSKGNKKEATRKTFISLLLQSHPCHLFSRIIRQKKAIISNLFFIVIFGTSSWTFFLYKIEIPLLHFPSGLKKMMREGRVSFQQIIYQITSSLDQRKFSRISFLCTYSIALYSLM